jgi:tetratricopeptide (TPR) repeat protein
VACCAALRSAPGAPPLVLLDRTTQAREAARLLPEEMRPAAIVPWPDEPAKLATRLAALLESGDPDARAPGPGYPELLAAVAVQRTTGVLEVRADDVHTRLHLEDGAVVLAEGGSLRETLGRLLLRRGALAEDDYARVIERMTETVFRSEPLRMGEVLVELGLMSPDEVFRALSEQVVEKVLAGFQARQVSYTLVPAEEVAATMGRFEVPPVEALLARGLAERARPEAAARVLRPHGERVATLAQDVEDVVRRFRPDAAGCRLLRAVDGRRTLGTLRRAGEGSEALLAALLLCGALRLADAARRPGVAVRPPPVTATREVVRAPRREPARRASSPTPDRRAPLEAEQAFRRGTELLTAERLDEALRELGRAVALQPQEPEYRMLEAFAAYLEHAARARLVRAKAVACAQRMAEHDPKAAKPHAILGRLALDEGQLDLAARELEAAVVRDPEDPEARRGLQRLRGRKAR